MSESLRPSQEFDETLWRLMRPGETTTVGCQAWLPELGYAGDWDCTRLGHVVAEGEIYREPIGVDDWPDTLRDWIVEEHSITPVPEINSGYFVMLEPPGRHDRRVEITFGCERNRCTNVDMTDRAGNLIDACSFPTNWCSMLVNPLRQVIRVTDEADACRDALESE